MKVQFTRYANNALISIYEWHKIMGYGKRGRTVRAAILKKTRLLIAHPFLGQEEETLKELGLGHRYLVEGNYKIIYFVVDQLVVISDVFDTRQDPGKMKP